MSDLAQQPVLYCRWILHNRKTSQIRCAVNDDQLDVLMESIQSLRKRRGKIENWGISRQYIRGEERVSPRILIRKYIPMESQHYTVEAFETWYQQARQS